MKLASKFKERKSLGEDVFEYLRTSIIDQEIKPGSRLVESKLADMMGISRTPIREAFHKLEREDWIRKNKNGGFKVVALSREEIEETFGIRAVLEAYAARLAAVNHIQKDLAPLEKKIAQYQDHLEKGTTEQLMKTNTEFHDQLYALSKSPKLIKMINTLRAQISRYRQIILTQEKLAMVSNEDHHKMMEAIKNREEDYVEQLVRKHILKGKQVVLEELAKQESDQ
ncbi:MAG: GntR family transcriptional regulator [Desulfobacteraceae bacterium]|nr:GntR family transcriptional regulator [Desulfobacteraceae bacterium]